MGTAEYSRLRKPKETTVTGVSMNKIFVKPCVEGKLVRCS